MAELKTKPTTQKAEEFLKTIEPKGKRNDSFTLLELFQKATGEKSVMWGTSIVGFGMFHYKSERSKQEGDWPLVGFSPRKQNLTLYIMTWIKDEKALLEKLGKYKMSGGCLYLNTLADVDNIVLLALIEKAYQKTKTKYE